MLALGACFAAGGGGNVNRSLERLSLVFMRLKMLVSEAMFFGWCWMVLGGGGRGGGGFFDGALEPVLPYLDDDEATGASQADMMSLVLLLLLWLRRCCADAAEADVDCGCGGGGAVREGIVMAESSRRRR